MTTMTPPETASIPEPLAEGLALHRHLRVAVDDQVPAALIDAAALQRIHRVARELPATLSDFFGFECRLAEPAAQADFLVCAKTPASRTNLARAPGAAPLPRGPVWDDLARFGERWADPASPCHAAVQNVWMEFDLPRDLPASAPLPLPSAFMGGQFLAGGQEPPAWLLDEAVPLCQGRPVPGDLRESLDRLVAVLPPHAHVFQLGLMLGRPGAGDALRVCLRGLQREDLQPLLRDLEWPGDPAELEAAWDFAAPHVAGMDLDLDLLPHTGPKLGLECSFGYDLESTGRLARFSSALVEQGLCLPAKREGLLAWSRITHQRGRRDWPFDLLTGAMMQPTASVSAFVRWVYHVKLDVQPGQPWVAKAYLAVAHHWLNADVLAAAKATAATARA